MVRSTWNGMLMRYANARMVLPERVLREVQRHFEGLLWVPVLRRRRRKTVQDLERNRRIVDLRRRGVPTSRISEQFNLSPQRIRQIVRDLRPQAKR